MALTTRYRDSHPTCDLCQSKPAEYDAPMKGGPWANMCPTCYGRHATQGVGTHFATRTEGPTHGLNWGDWSKQMEGHFRREVRSHERDLPGISMMFSHPADHADYSNYFHMHPKDAAKAIVDEALMDFDSGEGFPFD